MKRECEECRIEKAERQFSPGMDVCKGCEARMHRAAEQYAFKAVQRDPNARTVEHKEWANDTKVEQQADRQKAPPREYPYPWRRSK